MQICNLVRRLCAVVLCSSPIIASAQDAAVKGEPFTAVYVFSGSLSDTGNYASVNGAFAAPYYKNRTTNGPAAIDILASRLQLSAEPSLYLTGQQAGTNYAVLHANAYGDLPIDLTAQVEAYLGPRFNVADPKGLYFIFIGANDIVSATIEQDDRKSELILANAIEAVDKAFRRLQGAGARIFYAPNNVNIGIAPVARQAGASDRATHFTVEFNRLWEEKLRQLERELHITIFRFDFFRFIEDMLNVGGTLGFTDVTHACLPLLATSQCDLDRFAFLTDLLPTERIHAAFGAALADALVQQLNSTTCTVNHRCGRQQDARAYAVIDVPEDPNNPSIQRRGASND